MNFSMNWEALFIIRNSTFAPVTIQYWWDQRIARRPLSVRTRDITNGWWCHSVLRMHRLLFSHWWTRFSRCVLIFFDDILIDSPTWDWHLTHVERVLDQLARNQLFAKLSKFTFGQTRVEYLGHIVSASGVEMDATKVQAILAHSFDVGSIAWLPWAYRLLKTFHTSLCQHRRPINESSAAGFFEMVHRSPTSFWPFESGFDAGSRLGLARFLSTFHRRDRCFRSWYWRSAKPSWAPYRLLF